MDRDWQNISLGSIPASRFTPDPLSGWQHCNFAFRFWSLVFVILEKKFDQDNEEQLSMRKLTENMRWFCLCCFCYVVVDVVVIVVVVVVVVVVDVNSPICLTLDIFAFWRTCFSSYAILWEMYILSFFHFCFFYANLPSNGQMTN